VSKPVLPPGTTPAMAPKVRSFGVLAGAYKAKNPKSLLTHACEVNERNYPVRVLCKRVDVDHIMPDYDTGEGPTCPVCLRKVKR
jgi:hypothetical protein